MQAGGIRHKPDFLPKAIRHSVESDFQSLDDRLLLGENLAFLPSFLPPLAQSLAQSLAQGLLDRDFFGVDEVGHVVLFLKIYQLFAEKQGLGFWQAHHPNH